MTLRRALSTRRGHRVTSQSVSFQFDGREYTAQAGDTVASALLAHGVRLFGRSVKYRRPRGVFAAGPEEPNALLTVGTQPCVIPNVSAPQLAITPQLIKLAGRRYVWICMLCCRQVAAFSVPDFTTRHLCGRRGERTKP